jgi:ABC-type uncharacterized transport system auxiliary subunit
MGSPRRQRVTLAGMLLLFCGCSGPYYYDLQTGIPASQGQTRIDKVLLIDRVAINETYRDYRIVCRESPFRVKYANSACWSKSPDELIEDAVAGYWRKRSVFRKVAACEDAGEPDWTMKIRVEAVEKQLFERKWHARLALDLEIVDSRSDAVLLSHSFDRKAVLEGKRNRLLPGKISLILNEELMKIEAALLERR